MSARTRRLRGGGALALVVLLASGCGTPPSASDDARTDAAAPGAGPSATSSGETIGSGPRVAPPPGSSDTATADDSTDRPPAAPTATRLPSSARAEVSGLAVSRADPARLWAINDSGNAALLHAFDRAGRPLGDWPLAVPNRDWEDLAALRLDGLPYLLVADTGDNLGGHADYALHLVAEPLPGETPKNAPLEPARTLRFRYEDGARDVEAVAVDETRGEVWLLSKESPRAGRSVAGGVYRLPLAISTEAEAGTPVARRVATLAAVPRGLESRLAATFAGVDLEQPTAFDLSSDGRSGCLLSYRHLRCFARRDGESWAETLARPADGELRHGLAQAEAMALSEDGLVWLTSEGRRAPLRALPLPFGAP